MPHSPHQQALVVTQTRDCGGQEPSWAPARGAGRRAGQEEGRKKGGEVVGAYQWAKPLH